MVQSGRVGREGQMRVSTRVPCLAGVAGRLKSIQTVGVGWLNLARFPTGQLSIFRGNKNKKENKGGLGNKEPCCKSREREREIVSANWENYR